MRAVLAEIRGVSGCSRVFRDLGLGFDGELLVIVFVFELLFERGPALELRDVEELPVAEGLRDVEGLRAVEDLRDVEELRGLEELREFEEPLVREAEVPAPDLLPREFLELADGFALDLEEPPPALLVDWRPELDLRRRRR